jgi:putative sigma-54 modulation protein
MNPLMRIEITGKHLDVTDAIRDYAEQKVQKLPRYYDGVQEIDVVLESRNHAFHAEIRVESEKHDTFVAHQDDNDVYRAIDLVSDKMTRQLRDFKEKLKNSKR